LNELEIKDAIDHDRIITY